MTQNHIPMRMCAACRQRKPKLELIRIAKIRPEEKSVPLSGKDTKARKLKIKKSKADKVCKPDPSKCQIFIDRSGKSHGRGMYICKDRICLKRARKIKKLEREFSINISVGLYSALEEELNEQEIQAQGPGPTES